jgi:hypothetical protein
LTKTANGNCEDGGTMSFYSDQAQQYEQMASDIQTRLNNEGKTLDDATYTGLETQRQDLEDKADDMIAADMKGTLAGMKVDQTRLAKSTQDLADAVKKIKKFDQIAAIVSAAIGLATAIASGDAGAVFDALECAEKAVADVLPKPKPGSLLDIAASADS